MQRRPPLQAAMIPTAAENRSPEGGQPRSGDPGLGHPPSEAATKQAHNKSAASEPPNPLAHLPLAIQRLAKATSSQAPCRPPPLPQPFPPPLSPPLLPPPSPPPLAQMPKQAVRPTRRQAPPHATTTEGARAPTVGTNTQMGGTLTSIKNAAAPQEGASQDPPTQRAQRLKPISPPHNDTSQAQRPQPPLPPPSLPLPPPSRLPHRPRQARPPHHPRQIAKKKANHISP